MDEPANPPPYCGLSRLAATQHFLELLSVLSYPSTGGHHTAGCDWTNVTEVIPQQALRVSHERISFMKEQS